MTVVSPASNRAEVERRGRIGSGALHEMAKEEEARRRPRLHEAWLRELLHLDAAGKAQTGHALWRVDTTLRPPIAIPPSAWLATD